MDATLRKWVFPVGVTLVLSIVLLWVGRTLAQGPVGPQGGGGVPIDHVSYQGRLDVSGRPANGNYDLRTSFWDAPSGGRQIDAGQTFYNQAVTNGVFSVILNPYTTTVGVAIFNGDSRWLQVEVAPAGTGTFTVLPRQEVTSAPYAMSLRPGAVVSAAVPFDGFVAKFNNTEVWGSAVLAVASSGSAVRAESTGGDPLVGMTEVGRAVAGYDYGTQQARGYGGYFYSANGVGVYGQSEGDLVWANMYAPGVYGTSAKGVGVYGVSGSTSFYQAGVRGDSQGNAAGVYGYSRSGMAGYFYSPQGQGLNASSASDAVYAGNISNSSSGLPALYTRGYVYIGGNLTVTGSKTGYVVDMAVNAGTEPLEAGDVVEIVGYGQPVLGEIPLVQVRKAAKSGSTKVAGVVDQPYTMARVEGTSDGPQEQLRPEKGGSIAPGGYLSIVTLGSFKVIKVDASAGAIEPGDLLVSSATPGYAMKSASPAPGAVLGKALGGLEAGTGVIPVLVTLH